MNSRKFITKKFIVISVITILIVIISSGYLYFSLNREMKESLLEKCYKVIHPPCLRNNEAADYKIEQEGKWKRGIITIFIIDKKIGHETAVFQTDTPSYNHYHPVELHKCRIYVIRAPLYDYENDRLPSGAAFELWQYSYDGKGEKILVFAEKDEKEVFRMYFDNDFRVDPLETYLALERGYLGKEDYALVIKDLNTQIDRFVLSYQSLLEKYPGLEGVFALNEWTKDSRYFWGHLQQGANVLGFFRIERDTWKIDILQTPLGTLGGTAFNPEYGYITYDTGPGWIGIDVIAEQIYDEWRKEGKKVDFYLYNLFTKEKTLLVTTDNPSWDFKPKWISDTELEYELPSGEKKIYKINE